MDSRPPQAKHPNQGTLHSLRDVAAPVAENGLVLQGTREKDVYLQLDRSTM